MRLVFFGDGTWATNTLRALLKEGHEILAVVLRRRETDDSLRRLAESEGLDVSAPQDVNAEQTRQWLLELNADAFLSVSYDQIIRPPLLGATEFGFLNCHAGKLPMYRGRAVVNWAIINGEQEIGITVHRMDEGIDTGDIIEQRSLPIGWTDDYGSVMEKVERGIPRVVVDAVNALDAGTATVRQQDPEFGTYFSKREPGDEWIDWERSSYEIYNKIRAITAPGPGARTMLKSRELVLWSARYQKDWPTYTAIPGQVVGQEPDGVRVKTGDSTIVVTSVQFDDETPTTPALRIGTRLGVNLRRVVRDLRSEVKELRREVARLSQETD